MKELDYIIVGSGLAGIAFAEQCIEHNKTFVVFEDNSQNSTTIAGGIYNPVILKRFTSVPYADDQLNLLVNFYEKLEQKLKQKLLYQLPVYRKFFSIEEQNDWYVAADKPLLSQYLDNIFVKNINDSLFAPFDFGKVNQTGFVDTKLMKTLYLDFLNKNQFLVNNSFDYNQVVSNEYYILYNNIKASNIVFAEGFGLHHNPFFNHLALDGTKGELLIIKADNLNLDVIINASIFILPLGNSLYKIGATYNWSDKTNQTTEEGKNELLEKLKTVINCEFEIIEHLAGVRPTVRDRKPLLGNHHLFKNYYLLNGLGTRGVMLAPWLAKMLFEHIEYQKPLELYCDINRFK